MRFFGTSGIRGDAQNFLTDEFCTSIGLTFVKFLENHNQQGGVAVGMDPRKSSRRIKDALFKGLAAGGRTLFDEGICPIPAMCWIMNATDIKATIMVTGSHIAENLNGLKFFAFEEEITKEHEKEIEQIFMEINGDMALQSKVEIISETRAQELYKEMLKAQAGSLKKIKVVVDCANGAQSVVIPELLRELGLHVVEINCSPKDDFIARDTDTDDKAVIDGLKDAVVKEKADLGIAFDGDGDRIVFVDEKGEFVQGEYSCSLIAKSIDSEIVVTTVSSSQVAETIGKKVVRTKVGSPYIIAGMKEFGSTFGFEQNGGAIFANNMYTRDGGTVMIKILSLLSNFNGSFSELIANLPKFYMHRTKVTCPVMLNRKILESAKATFKGKKAEEIDGLKIWLDNTTWILFRPSANAPEFRVFAESLDDLKSVKLLEEGINFVRDIISQKSMN